MLAVTVGIMHKCRKASPPFQPPAEEAAHKKVQDQKAENQQNRGGLSHFATQN